MSVPADEKGGKSSKIPTFSTPALAMSSSSSALAGAVVKIANARTKPGTSAKRLEISLIFASLRRLRGGRSARNRDPCPRWYWTACAGATALLAVGRRPRRWNCRGKPAIGGPGAAMAHRRGEHGTALDARQLAGEAD